METQYYGKELVANKLRLSNGRVCPFEVCAKDTGVIATTDPAICAELDVCIKHRRSGVFKITAQEYADLKKKPLEQPLLPKSPRSVRELIHKAHNPRPKSEDAVAVRPMPSDPQRNTTIVVDLTPTVVKMKTLKRTVPAPAPL